MEQSRPGVLIVTRKGSTKLISWADIASSAKQAMSLWREKRHGFVYADFGDLGDGMTGARLAAAIRQESDSAVIILLVDQVQPHHHQWAVRNGATDAIERTSKAILRTLPASIGQPRPSDFPSSFFAEESNNSAARLVDERLKKYGRMGPARSIVMEDAMAHFQKSGSAPSVSELAKRVAREIPNAEDRAQFLKSFDSISK